MRIFDRCLKLLAFLLAASVLADHQQVPRQNWLSVPQFYSAAAQHGVVFFVGWGSSGFNDFDAVRAGLRPILRSLDCAYPGWRPVFGGDPSSDGGIGLVMAGLKSQGYSPIAVAADKLKEWDQPYLDNTEDVFYYPTQYSSSTGASSDILWGGINKGQAVMPD